MTIKPVPLVALMVVAAGLSLFAALSQAQRAVTTAERDLLAAEASIAARLLRDTGGSDRVASLFGDRVSRSSVRDTNAVEVVIDEAVPARATTSLFDADGWDVVGQVVVVEDASRRATLPTSLYALAAVACAALVALAMWCVARAGASGPSGSLRWPVFTWLAVGSAVVLVPAALAERWAQQALATVTAQRLAVAGRVLAARDDVEALARVPSGILGVTGLRFVPTGAADRDQLLASGLPVQVAQALASASPDASGRVVVEHVSYATADVAGARLILLPYEHVRRPTSPMVAAVALGLLLGVPMIVLSSTIRDARRARRELAAWSFLAPGLLHLAAFTIGPLVFAAWLSLHRWSLVDPARPFVGLENYTTLASNAGFWNALLNTATFTLHVPFSMALALGLALLVRRPGRSSVVARAAFFLPSITSLVAVAMVWQWMLNDEYGLANAALEAAGLPRVRWLSSPSLALVSIMIVATWTTVGFQTVLFQAGLTAIPPDLYDAARIDGASRWRQFRHVTLPGLRPTLVFVLITSVISSFQVFGTVYVMTQGGPLHATDVAVFHIYEEAWELQRVGSAAAMSWTLFAVIFAVTWLHFRTLEQRAEA